MIPVDRVGDMVMVGEEVLSLDAAEELADKIREAVAAARKDAAAKACEAAGGHAWDGYDAVIYGGPNGQEHVRSEWCTRDGCHAERIRPGWMAGGGGG